MACPTRMTLAEARNALAARKLSAKELTEAHIAAVEKARPLNAFTLETPEQALEMAEASDARLASGDARPLEGLPLGIKDNFCTIGLASTAASRMLKNFKPSYESQVTANLWRDGAIMLGKLNMDEFAMGSSNMTSAFGGTENPWRAKEGGEKLVPGGSSGGSAAAVAARCALGATGTDTGGSIRQPAAFTGTVGLKPTYGRCSRWGIISFASSLDQAGPMARTTRDCAILLRSMAGHDPRDSTSAELSVPDFEQALTGDIRGLKVGIPQEYQLEGLSPELQRLWQQGADWLKAAGAETVEISLPHTQYAPFSYYIIASAEASSNLARYDGVRYGLRAEGDTLEEMYAATRAAGFGYEVKRRIFIGTYALSEGNYDAYYNKARSVRTLIARDFAEAFEQVEVMLMPATPTPAFSMEGGVEDPIAMFMNDVFTVPASLAGVPAIALPAGLSEKGLPLGLQLVGRPFDEATLLRVADVFEKAAAFEAEPAFVASA